MSPADGLAGEVMKMLAIKEANNFFMILPFLVLIGLLTQRYGIDK
jgi:hypothetical protein